MIGGERGMDKVSCNHDWGFISGDEVELLRECRICGEVSLIPFPDGAGQKMVKNGDSVGKTEKRKDAVDGDGE